MTKTSKLIVYTTSYINNEMYYLKTETCVLMKELKINKALQLSVQCKCFLTKFSHKFFNTF